MTPGRAGPRPVAYRSDESCPLLSESDARAKLKRPGFAHSGSLAERWRWAGRIRAGSEVAVACQHVHMIRHVEALREQFELNAAAEVQRATETDVQTEEVVSLAQRTSSKRPHMLDPDWRRGCIDRLSGCQRAEGQTPACPRPRLQPTHDVSLVCDGDCHPVRGEMSRRGCEKL